MLFLDTILVFSANPWWTFNHRWHVCYWSHFILLKLLLFFKRNFLTFDPFFHFYFSFVESCISDSLCQNGGLCMPRGYNRFCHCQEGTSGDFCEEVDICNKLCGKGDGVVCKYDLKQRIAECVCRDNKYEFDTVTKSCRRMWISFYFFNSINKSHPLLHQ